MSPFLALYHSDTGEIGALPMDYLPQDRCISIAHIPSIDLRIYEPHNALARAAVNHARRLAWFLEMREIPTEVPPIMKYPLDIFYCDWRKFLPNQWIDRSGNLRDREGRIIFSYAGP